MALTFDRIVTNAELGGFGATTRTAACTVPANCVGYVHWRVHVSNSGCLNGAPSVIHLRDVNSDDWHVQIGLPGDHGGANNGRNELHAFLGSIPAGAATLRVPVNSHIATHRDYLYALVDDTDTYTFGVSPDVADFMLANDGQANEIPTVNAEGYGMVGVWSEGTVDETVNTQSPLLTKDYEQDWGSNRWTHFIHEQSAGSGARNIGIVSATDVNGVSLIIPAAPVGGAGAPVVMFPPLPL